MYWEDRYVKGCCWQLLLLPRWLVPNDRLVEKGVFDNAATTIRQIPFPFTLFIFRFFALFSALISSQIILGYFTGLHCAMHFVSFCRQRIVVRKIAYHLAHSKNTLRHPQIHKSHFLSPPCALQAPSHMCQINNQAGVGGGAFAAWWGYMLHWAPWVERTMTRSTAPLLKQQPPGQWISLNKLRSPGTGFGLH